MKRLIYSIVLVLVINISANAQKFFYEEAFDRIDCMLENKCRSSFKNAVYEVENAYLEGSLDSIIFNDDIKKLVQLAESLIKNRTLKYEGADKVEVEKYAALFSVMKDSIDIQDAEGNLYKYIPYAYDFNDIWGHGDWKNMFVSKLMATRRGNCHSLPFLYKILAEELGAKANLALAPNHIYIKHWNEKDGWYNTELTSGIFPIDSWLMASGYIHLDAVANKLYMEALNDKQSLALCLVDLAQGFNRKFPENDGEFVIKCVNKALEYYPTYVNAMILMAETFKTQLERRAIEDYAGLNNEALQDETLRSGFLALQNVYGQIHDLGYRRMPEEMYLDWLTSLQEEREKFENKKILNH